MSVRKLGRWWPSRFWLKGDESFTEWQIDTYHWCFCEHCRALSVYVKGLHGA